MQRPTPAPETQHGGAAHDPLPDHLRLQRARALAAASLLQPALFGSAGELRHLARHLKAPLLDPSYPVRAASGQLAAALLLATNAPERMLASELEPHLPLHLPWRTGAGSAGAGGSFHSGSAASQDAGSGAGAGGGGGSLWERAAEVAERIALDNRVKEDEDPLVVAGAALAPFWETGALALAEAALAAPAAERRAALLLCAHAAGALGKLAGAPVGGGVAL